MGSRAKLSIALIAGTLIFIGLPLLSWGPARLDLFFSHPARLIYCLVMVLFQFTAVLINPDPAGRKIDKTHSKFDLVLIQVISLFVVIAGPYSDGHAVGVMAANNLIRYLGLVLLTMGFFFMQIAQKHLADQFSVAVTLQDDHQLVTTGLYRFVRHPRYAGMVLFFSGFSFVFDSWPALGGTGLLLLILLWRIKAEEALMKEQFPRGWESYQARSWRLVPFIF